MDPINQSINGARKQVINAFPAALEALNMSMHGHSERLGLVSIKQENQPMLYAHVVEH